MSMGISIGDLIRVKVVFRELQDGTEDYSEPIEVDGDVSLNILLNDVSTTPQPFIALRYPASQLEPIQYYYYDWEPTETGVFKLIFSGTVNTEPVSITEEFVVGVDAAFGLTLMEDQEILFLGEISPLYVDPESIVLHYPETNLAEAAEYIHRYSVEVDKLLGYPNELPFIAYEYIQAAALCSLGKIYDYGLGGGEASSISLGDLAISSQSYPKQRINRANASNWCELAAAFRDEMIRGNANLKTVVAGKNRPNPMPKRGIRYAADASNIDNFRFTSF